MHLWSVQLSESLSWKTHVKYKFREKGHINLQEARCRRTVIKRAPFHSKICIMQDSRVCLGASLKGRSPSQSLNRVLVTELPYVVGMDLHIGGIYNPTWSIRADDVSRDHPIRDPTAPVPAWFWALRARGPAACLTELDALSMQSRGLAR